MSKNYLIIDTETGGLNPKLCGLCEVAFKVYGKDVKDKFFIRPNPNLLYEDKAMSINKIQRETLMSSGITEMEAVLRICKFINDNFSERPLLMGQNVMFDKGFVEELFRRNNSDFNKFIHYHFMDTMIISNFLKDANIIPEHVPTRLTETYKFLCDKSEEDIVDAHTAMFDVEMVEAVYNKQLENIF